MESALKKNEIVDAVRERLDVYAIYLFGSAARNEQRLDSDLDIAFLSDQSYPPYDLFIYGEELAGILHCDVDLVDMNQASTVMQKQVIGEGVLLLDERPYERQLFTLRVLKEYAYLNEERAEVLEAYGFGGMAHGRRYYY
ncbi:type VII toxin-antitoxin system MntA family adenylyltransferase antitoxin [Natribacillus halophilus]|uniref:Predicted nucleotidyltransferase n=1 Tax=Natribacillus halophilus TaxID=549003 RepID=A0A1G8S9M5_9BACI|nr:nucleotidyltransferase domain-containing protein [Natribacillus halophilus]SDJ25861.1 Predicted nucleotidyltransferase [Natribacillus halophilus]